MRKLSSLGFRHSRVRKGRTVLTGLGITLGVGIFFATMVSNATTEASLSALIHDFTGDADVWVTSPGFERYQLRDLDEVAEMPDVELVVPRVSVTAKTPGNSDSFTFFGADVDGDQSVYSYQLEPGSELPKRSRHEVLMPRRLADDLGVGVGSEFRIDAAGRQSRWTVSGILADRGAGRAFDGRFVEGWLGEVQRATGTSGEVDNAVLVLRDGVDGKAWIEQYTPELPEGLTAIEPGAEGGSFLQVLAATQSMFLGVSFVAVIVAIFLVYNSLSMALAERVQEYGTLRALGATRRQIMRVVIVEAFALGIVSTAAGLALGLALARMLISLMEGIFRREVNLDVFTVPVWAVAAAVVIGLLVTLVAALMPAWRAGRVDPIVAMRNTGRMTAERRLGKSWLVGAALVGLPLVFVAVDPGSPFAMIVSLLPLVGAILMVPLVLRPFGTVVGAAVQPIARGVGRIAVGHLTRERSRSAMTLGILMAVLAMIVTIGAINVSMGNAILSTIDKQFGSDFTIHADGGNWDTLPHRLLPKLERVPEVGMTSSLTFHTAQAREEDGSEIRVFVDGVEPGTFFDIVGFDYAEGNEASARGGIERGGIMLGQRTAKALGLRMGDFTELNTKKGRRRFKVVAVVKTAALMNLAYVSEYSAERIWGEADPNLVNVNLRPGVSVEQGERAISEALRGLSFELETKADVEADVREEFNGFFAPFWAILATSVIVGLLGIANTLAMVVLQRFREFGVLRAIGVGRGGVRRMVLVEALTMAGVAFLLALPLGAYLSSSTLGGVGSMTGFEATWTFPTSWAAIALAVAAAVGTIGALLPGRRAARIEIVAALAYE